MYSSKGHLILTFDSEEGGGEGIDFIQVKFPHLAHGVVPWGNTLMGALVKR